MCEPISTIVNIDVISFIKKKKKYRCHIIIYKFCLSLLQIQALKIKQKQLFILDVNMQKKVLQLVQDKESLEINKQLSSHSECFIKLIRPGQECHFSQKWRKYCSLFLKGSCWVIKNGQNTRIWHDNGLCKRYHKKSPSASIVSPKKMTLL